MGIFKHSNDFYWSRWFRSEFFFRNEAHFFNFSLMLKIFLSSIHGKLVNGKLTWQVPLMSIPLPLTYECIDVIQILATNSILYENLSAKYFTMKLIEWPHRCNFECPHIGVKPFPTSPLIFLYSVHFSCDWDSKVFAA